MTTLELTCAQCRQTLARSSWYAEVMLPPEFRGPDPSPPQIAFTHIICAPVGAVYKPSPWWRKEAEAG